MPVSQPHTRAKLTEAEVLEIDRLLQCKTPRAVICERFGVADGAVDRIAARETWRYLLCNREEAGA